MDLQQQHSQPRAWARQTCSAEQMIVLGAAEEAELKTEAPLMTTTTMTGTPGLSVAALEIVSVALFTKFTSNQSKVRYQTPQKQ